MSSKTNLSGNMYFSCGNLSSSNSVKPAPVDINNSSMKSNNINSNVSSKNIYSRRASKMKTSPKDDAMSRPKSLLQLHDDLLPLLEAASSLSSIGSYNELTEDSFLESSYSDDSNKNVLVRRGGKLRNIKHRPHSFALCDHSLVSIPENIIENSLKKRHGLYMQSLNNIQKSDTSLKHETTSDSDENQDPANINNINNNNNNNNNRDNIINSENEKNKINSKNLENLENIAIPRRRCRSNNSNKNNIMNTEDGELNGRSASCCELSFSKEQKKKLKQKMRDTKKSPEKSVFLGLF